MYALVFGVSQRITTRNFLLIITDHSEETLRSHVSFDEFKTLPDTAASGDREFFRFGVLQSAVLLQELQHRHLNRGKSETKHRS